MKQQRQRGHRERFQKRDKRSDASEKIYIYGKHALEEALINTPGVIRKVWLSSEAMEEETLRELLKKRGIIPQTLAGPRDAERMVGEETSHQGVIATVDPTELVISMVAFERKLEAEPLTEKTMLVLLDELTDPHNVGAIIRSAAAFGAAGVLIPERNQAPITGAVVKASAGMVFRVPLVSIGNVNQAVDSLKEMGFSVYGLAMKGTKAVSEETFAAPALIIVGNEGKGIREKTLERCDVVLRIPMDPRAESLNASVSAAIVLYQWSVRHLS
jgi:23S rRNA (guanosine2251-2'-O)-methyltransferase